MFVCVFFHRHRISPNNTFHLFIFQWWWCCLRLTSIQLNHARDINVFSRSHTATHMHTPPNCVSIEKRKKPNGNFQLSLHFFFYMQIEFGFTQTFVYFFFALLCIDSKTCSAIPFRRAKERFGRVFEMKKNGLTLFKWKNVNGDDIFCRLCRFKCENSKSKIH